MDSIFGSEGGRGEEGVKEREREKGEATQGTRGRSGQENGIEVRSGRRVK